MAVGIIAPKAGEHVLIQGIEAKSKSERNCIRCGKLIGSGRDPFEEAGLCPFAFGDIWLLAPIYIRKMVSYRKVTVRISIHHDDGFDKIDAGITDMLT